MEVDSNGSLSYPEPQTTASDSGKVISEIYCHFSTQLSRKHYVF